MRFELDDLSRPRVRGLIDEHLSDMHATSPPESIHALSHDDLVAEHVTFWTVWDGDALLGCGALKEIDPAHGEIKTMRTTSGARGRGVGAAVLAFLLDEARRRGYTRVSLETGSQDFFAPARRLYARNGFVECSPFAGYVLDPNSVFMTREL